MNKNRYDLISDFINNALKVKSLVEQSSTVEEKKITLLQMRTLNFVEDNPGCSVSDLSNELMISLSATTQLTNRLVEAGLMLRESNHEDRRVIKLYIDKKGYREIASFRKSLFQTHFSVFSDIPESDLQYMIKIFKRLLNSNKKGE